MKYKKIKIFSYELPLVQSLKNSQGSYASSKGYVIKLFIDDQCGCGEASPLFNFSKETLRQILWAFEELKTALEYNQEYSKEEFLEIFKIFSNHLPSLRFALDVALYDVLSQCQSMSLACYLNPHFLKKIRFSSLHMNKKKNNNKIIKVKVGFDGFKNEVLYFENIVNQYSKDTVFRLDFNKAFSLQDTISFCNKVSSYKIEFIEEPLRDLTVNNLRILKNKTNIPIAIDETLHNKSFKTIIDSGLIDYAVLKPSIYGSVSQIFNLKSYLKKNNIKIIISSSLENYIGNLASIHIASALELDFCHGVNNFNFYKYNIKKMPYLKEDTSINIESLIGVGSCWDD